MVLCTQICRCLVMDRRGCCRFGNELVIYKREQTLEPDGKALSPSGKVEVGNLFISFQI